MESQPSKSVRIDLNLIQGSEEDSAVSRQEESSLQIQPEEYYEFHGAGSEEEDDDVVFAIETEDEQDDDGMEVTATTPDDPWSWRDGAPTLKSVPKFQPIDPATKETRTPGLQVDMPCTAAVMDFLRLFITEEMMETIALETNRYAGQMIASANLKPESHFHSWEDTTVNEMWAFFGLIIAEGFIQIADIQHYFSRDSLLGFPFFLKAMSRDRFMSLLTFFHVNDNSKFIPRGEDGHDLLFKLSPFLTSLEKTFAHNWYPGMNMVLEEAMFRVYSADKAQRYGVKVYQLHDSNGYCCTFEIYKGKTEASPKGATYDVVMRLLSPYLGVGHHLYVNNLDSSPLIFKDLLSAGTGACGMIRRKSKFVDSSMKQKGQVKKKGDQKLMTTGSMNHIKFMENKEINVLTTIHSGSKSDTGGTDHATGKPVVKFNAVKELSKHTEVVDRFSDQLLQLNSGRTGKWWKKVFFHFLNLAQQNAYIIYLSAMSANRGAGPLTYSAFRQELVKEMVALCPNPKLRRRSNTKPEDITLRRLTDRHFPTKVQPTHDKPKPAQPGKRNRSLTRTCVVCSTTTGKSPVQDDMCQRKESTIECSICDVGLCIIPCFEVYHTHQDYKLAYRQLQETPDAGTQAKDENENINL